MRKLILGSVLAATCLIVPVANAIPNIQLYVAGGSWDAATETWVTSSSTFDLYVIAKSGINNVKVSMALDRAPGGCSVDVNGTNYNSFTYGYPPLSNDPATWDGGSEDLAKHGIYPAWFTEFNAGNYGNSGKIGDATGGGTWLPTSGYLPGAGGTRGEFRKFSIKVNGDCGVHFDAYTLNSDGTIDKFAPFSHDAEKTGKTPPPGVPEPASMLLFGLGLAGASIARRLKK